MLSAVRDELKGYTVQGLETASSINYGNLGPNGGTSHMSYSYMMSLGIRVTAYNVAIQNETAKFRILTSISLKRTILELFFFTNIPLKASPINNSNKCQFLKIIFLCVPVLKSCLSFL